MDVFQELFALAAIFGSLVGFVWIRRHFAARVRHDVQETIRAAIQSGQTLTPETVRTITADYDVGRTDLRWGLTCIAIALGLLVLAAVFPTGSGEGEFPASFKPLIAGTAAFPGFIGLARLFLHMTRPRDVV